MYNDEITVARVSCYQFVMREPGVRWNRIGDLLDEAGEALAAELGDAARYVHLDVTA